MRKTLALSLCIAALVSLVSFAGENRFLGTIRAGLNDGGPSSANNTNTDAGAFAIPAGVKITANCSVPVSMLVDNLTTADSGVLKGLPIPASTNFPTSVGRFITTTGLSLLSDGGWTGTAVQTSVVSIYGAGTCDLWQRSGDE